MYSFYKQTHFGTSIENSERGHFFDSKSEVVAVSKGNVLEVYTVRKNSRNDYKLHLTGSYSFFALIKCFCFAKFAGHSRDSILLGFENSMMSIIKFNKATNDIRTISMHTFDRHYRNEGYRSQHFRYLAVTDPLNRCTVMSVSESKVLVMPLTNNNLTFLKNQRRLVEHRDLEPDEIKTSSIIKEKSINKRH
ncbi:Cleavage and polyadenylation specificity factor subunit 1, variant 2 [Bonamia ostreae]|uniref:Cleavage and polyadenylation specificity factor subunit 1, variant 2 n=1 Tax=Bonamia ostreae TaxID=126728 RepID=A0ABV2AID9_9EUKA